MSSFAKRKLNVVSDYKSNLSETGQYNINPDLLREKQVLKLGSKMLLTTNFPKMVK